MQESWQALNLILSLKMDDPEAPAKLVQSLERRRVRLQVLEMCWHFGFERPTADERAAAQAFLEDRCDAGELVRWGNDEYRLYCRPDMLEGQSISIEGAATLLEELTARRAERRAALPKAEQKSLFAATRRKFDQVNREREAKELLAFAVAQCGAVTLGALKEEGARLGLSDTRVTQLIKYLTSTRALRRQAHAVYEVAPPETDPPATPIAAEAKPEPVAKPQATLKPNRTKRDWRHDLRGPKPGSCGATAAAPASAVTTAVKAKDHETARDWPKPKTQASSQLHRRKCWILIWLQGHDGSATQACLAKAATQIGMIAEPTELELPLARLIEETRLYRIGQHLVFTEFGRRDAEYLHLRREAFEAPVRDDA
jgi:hypothetical protein